MTSDDTKSLLAEIAQLKEALKLRDDALRLAKVAHWHWDAETDRIEYNKRDFFAVLGFPADQGYEEYDDCKRHVHPDDLAHVNAVYEQADNAQEGFALTYRLINPDGKIRSVYEVARAEFDAGGRFLGHKGIIQDVTDRQETEVALEETRALFRRIADAAPLVISVKDAEGRFVFANRTLAERHGMTQAEIVGKTARDTLGQAQGALAEALDRQVFREGEVVPFFEETIVIDARQRDMLTTKVPIKGIDDRTKFVATICLDITDRREAERALRKSEQRLRGFTEAASDWFWEQDSDLRFTYVSARREEAHLMDDQSLLGRRRDEVFRHGIPDEEARWSAHLETLAARRNFRDFVYSFRRTDGETRVLRISGVAVRDQDGQFQGYRGVGSDITAEVDERRRLEEAVEKLRQIQKMESIGQMTGGVAHDFNNLLAIIQGNAELLQDRGGTSDPMLEAIVRASGRGASLVQRMLAFARRQALYPKAFDLDERIEQMLDMLRRTLGEAIEIDFAPGADSWFCLADAGQVDDALLNLALNARDAMPNGGRLEISSEKVTVGNAAAPALEPKALAELTPGDYLLLTVRDNGVGVDPRDLENVFEPFFTTKEFGRGSGLGLSMVYGFAKQSGGHVSLESAPGGGATARLYLPRAGQSPSAKDAAHPSAVPRGQGERILVVEDKEDVRSLVERQLEQLGYQARTAVRGDEALVLLKSNGPFDLLLSDVVLPGNMSGAVLATEARAHDVGLAVLLMSGYCGSAFGAEMPGVEDWPLIRKPFRQAELAAALRQVLGKAPPSEAGALTIDASSLSRRV